VHTKSWTLPFREAFRGNHRVEIINLQLTEGWFTSKLLGGMIARIVKHNTPVEDYDTTLLCLRSDLEEFRDALRIHNVMAGYVFLLDGIGRVRFAGSGEATEQELENVIQFARELIRNPKSNRKPRKGKGRKA
jgi:mitochondrial ATPase complex subunit ATP10